jgi:hypothetical protein
LLRHQSAQFINRKSNTYASHRTKLCVLTVLHRSVKTSKGRVFLPPIITILSLFKEGFLSLSSKCKTAWMRCRKHRNASICRSKEVTAQNKACRPWDKKLKSLKRPITQWLDYLTFTWTYRVLIRSMTWKYTYRASDPISGRLAKFNFI